MDFRIVAGGGRKILREGLALLLEKQDGYKLIGEAEDVGAVAKLVKALPADAAVLIESSTAPILVEQVSAILRASRELRIIILAINPELRWLRAVLDLGIAACLNKDCSGEELVAALRAARAKQLYLSPALLQMVVNASVKTDTRALRSLAPREREILRRIAEGQITKRIAADLGIGAKTVETHRRRIMAKLRASGIADLTKHAIRQGLTSLEVNA